MDNEDDVRFQEVGGLKLAYRLFGHSDGRRVALVTGFGDQMTEWPRSLIDGLVTAGCYILVYEPRDSGLSDSFANGTVYDVPTIMGAAMGSGVRADYDLDDLANELIGLTDQLGFSGAHLIGYSMGGMIIQRAALRAPSFASLTLVFTSSGAPHLSQGSPESAMASLALTQPQAETERVTAGMRLIEITNGKTLGKSEAEARHEIEASQKRAYRPDGVGRMMMALLSSAPAFDRLSELEMPVLVLSAEQDCFFGPDHAQDLIERITHAQLMEIAGSGHNLPEPVGAEILRLWSAHQNKSSGNVNA